MPLFLKEGVNMTFEMNGILWTVRMVNSNSPLLMRSNHTMTVGMCDRSTCEIYLSDRLQGAFLRKVLIHEICHSAMLSYDINISVPEEERLCDFVASYGDEIFAIVDSLFMALRRIA